MLKSSHDRQKERPTTFTREKRSLKSNQHVKNLSSHRHKMNKLPIPGLASQSMFLGPTNFAWQTLKLSHDRQKERPTTFTREKKVFEIKRTCKKLVKPQT
jgi:hypothetical protein